MTSLRHVLKIVPNESAWDIVISYQIPNYMKPWDIQETMTANILEIINSTLLSISNSIASRWYKNYGKNI